MKRRSFLRGSLGFLAAAALPKLPGVRITPRPEFPERVAGAKTPRRGDGFAENLAGEDLWYEISVLYFIKAAVGRVSFQRTARPGHFRAIAEAHAVGFVGWATNYRKVGFYSDLAVMDQGGTPRLVTVRFRRETTREDTQYRSIHQFDYKRRRWFYRVYQDGKLTRARSRPIPDGVWYDDLITAAYNFRLGVYGPPKKGMSFSVSTIPYQGVDRFTVRLCTQEEEARESAIREKVPEAAYIVHVPIDQKVFGIKAGLARFVGDKDLKPLAVAIQDTGHFGDVFAELIPKPGG
jgi:hypothetical protein